MNTIEHFFDEYKVVKNKESVVSKKETDFSEVIDFLEENDRKIDALQVVSAAITQFPLVEDFHFRKAAIEVAVNQIGRAIVTLENAEKVLLPDLRIVVRLLDLYLLSERYQEALLLLSRAELYLDETDLVQIYYYKVIIYRESNQTKLCFKALCKLLTIQPDHQSALELLFLTVEETGDYEDAIEFYQQILDETPDNARAWYNLANALVAMEELEYYKQAADAYDKVLELSNNFPQVYTECGELYLNMEDFLTALKYFELGLAINPTQPLLHVRAGEANLALRQNDYAEAHFLTALQFKPSFSEAVFGLANCKMEQNAPAAALELYREAILLNCDDVRFVAGMARAYTALKSWDLAHISFEKVVKMEPETIEYWYEYAQMLVQQGKFQRAVRTLEVAEHFHPDHPALILYRILTTLDMGETAKAMYYIFEFLQDEPDGQIILKKTRPALFHSNQVQDMIQRIEGMDDIEA